MAKPNKTKPHRTKPYDQKMAERAAAKRSAQTGHGRGDAWTRPPGDNPTASRPAHETQLRDDRAPPPGSDTIIPPE